MNGKEALFAQLEQSPEDWDVRIALIEMAVREGDLAGAKRLVRASPSDILTPTAIQVRIHALLTRGIDAVGSQDQVPEREQAARPIEPVPPEVVPPETARSTGPGRGEPAAVASGIGEKRREQSAVPVGSGVPSSSPTGGGSAALVERHTLPEPSPRRSRATGMAETPATHRGTVSTPRIGRRSALEKWRDYDGGLLLADLEPPEHTERPSQAGERVSSVSLALLAHIAFLVLLSLVAVQVHRPEPPQLVVSVHHDREAELVTTRIARPQPEVQPSAAAAQSLDVLSSVALSASFAVPEVERTSDAFVAADLAGFAPVGSGVSLSAEAVRSSDVNFFGLSGTGRRIVFIVDATPEMLIDEKGGMSAYNKVKNEIGTMLAGLNRGTEFNLLLFQGKELVAFREEPVPGLPSNLRQAIEWLDPLNRDYGSLGLRGRFGRSLEVSDRDDLPIAAGDLAHYAKAVHKALEWRASAIFCITAGYRGMTRAPTPEMLEQIARMPPRQRGTVDERAQRAWNAAVEKTRAWLEKENAARRERGLDPKVVVNFNQLVREITGATPPRATSPNGGPEMPRMPPVTPEDVEQQVRLLVKERYKAEGLEEPSLHLVLFLGNKEDIAAHDEAHFKSLTRRNRGKLKVLRGLAALKNVTGS